MVAAALILLAACSKGGAGEPQVPSATVGTAAPTTTTTDPYAVPPVIDAAYVNRVLAGLDAQMGDVTRLVVSTRTIPREAYDRMRAVYATDSALQLSIDGFQSDLRNNLPGYQANPGNIKTLVTQLIHVTNSCVYAQVDRDYSATSTNPNPNFRTQWVAIQPLDPARDTHGYNVVRWSYRYEGFNRGFTAPPTDPCVST